MYILLSGLGFLIFTLLLHWQAGSFHSEFGRYQDEGMHYVTGLMLRDFLLSPSHWLHPMPFARDYYLHFPKVGLGNWPPLFPILQAGWELIFGVSRTSLLFLMMVLNSLLAACVHHSLRGRIHPVLAVLAGLLTIAAPLSQAQTSMVMAEVPLALLSFLALLAFTRFLDSGSRTDALAFGLWTTAAIMTKGNAWVIFLVAPAALLLAGKLSLVLTRAWWMALAIVMAVCLPYTWFSMSIVTQGWDTHSFPGFNYLVLSLWKHILFVVEILGPGLTAAAVVGWAVRVRPASSYWLVMGLYALAIIGFHVAVPTSIEARKLYQIVPIVALFAAAGLDWLAHRIPLPRPAWAAGAIGVLFFLWSPFHFLPPFIPGFGDTVQKLIARPDSAGAVVLISSDPFTEDAEAALIAEWAERDRNRGVYLARGTKLLSDPALSGGRMDYVPVYRSPAELSALLDRVPVAYVILDTAATPQQRTYRHHGDLATLLAKMPDQWELFSDRSRLALGHLHRLTIYRNRRDLRGVPVRLNVDLSRKIGSNISTEP